MHAICANISQEAAVGPHAPRVGVDRGTVVVAAAAGGVRGSHKATDTRPAWLLLPLLLQLQW